MNYIINRTAKQHWVFKYKLHHIPFWLAYNYAWWAIQTGDPLAVWKEAFYSVYATKFWFYVIFQAAAAYFSLYVLIPKLLEKGHIAAFVISVVSTILCAASLITFGYYIGSIMVGRNFNDMYGHEFNFFSMLVGNPLPTTAASTTLAMSIKLTKNWVESRRRQQLLENEKLETELQFLKYQFNPHFLFNSINSIFFLIHKNPDVASASLAKFSDLLRHQLYECNDNQISLSKEITYLENFIELEKLRQNSNIQVTVAINSSQTGHVMVAPFVLMTFVENAFKHVSRHTDKPNTIHIQLELDRHNLYFTVANTAAQPGANKDVVYYGGIGLHNVKRRLDLIYNNNYNLDIQNEGGHFTVKLRLHLLERTVKQNAAEETTVLADA